MGAVVVTGATGGLGPAIVRAFLARGERVAAAARGREGLERLAESLGRPAALSLIAADLSSSAGAEAAVGEDIDVLVHAVGSWTGGHPVADAPDNEVDWMLDANFRSAWFCGRAAMRRMRARRGGRIVFVAAVGGLEPTPGAAAYGAAKAALLSLMRSLAEEGRSHGIACNAVAPGTIDTEANRRAMPDVDPSGWVTPEEVASAVVYLASPEAAAVTGSTLVVARG
jgi:NAD(P)-dependent dehydrogenase (short-subunit alcohol dehydrogenase family)